MTYLPQGNPNTLGCRLLTTEQEFITNTLPQSGLVDTLTRSESIQLAFYTPNDTLIRSESIQLAVYTPNDTLNSSETMSFVNT